ncbi:DNA glycosylase AlkZ-like family protein [Nakamurella lactea]|uniref:DNA glycosylase AlkZ-like family protein n=1 Tax=Nakamurella lactea TaxID=459515 RepID=UPI0004224311|nr:crosslink repair DNA glycosylase YcaQ family protein [Nakamurella lactea]
MSVTRAQVLKFRWRAHQLDREPGSAAGLADVDLLDFGVQDTGPAAARWALTNRGLTDYDEADTLLAWTLRVSPHLYRRADVAAIATASSPFSEPDAAKRIFDAAKPLTAAGISVTDGLAVVAREQRRIVAKPMVKGALSTALTAALDPPYLRECGPCGCVHCWESSFRIVGLQAGLELQPGTSPPVLQRIPGFRAPLYGRSGADADPQFSVIRNYLRFFGPARPADVAAFLDMPTKVVAAHWPQDTVPVEVTDAPTVRGERFLLAGQLEALTAAPEMSGTTRLLGPYDAYLQARDRPMLVADPAHSKDLWRILGRPGAVAVDGEIVGTWRPKSTGSKLTINWEAWLPVTAGVCSAVAAQAERLATVRGQTLNKVTGG